MSKQAQNRKSYHVVHNGDMWEVKTTKTSKVTPGRSVARNAQTGRFVTQLDAVRAARAQAKKSGAELVIHGRDGRIVDVDSYRNKALVRKFVPTR